MGKVGEVSWGDAQAKTPRLFFMFSGSVHKKLTLHVAYAIIISAISKRNTLIFNITILKQIQEEFDASKANYLR